MNCHRIQNRILDWLPLPPGEDFPEDIRRHLMDCPDCQAFYREHAQAIEAIQPPAPPSLSTDFKANLMCRIRAGESQKEAIPLIPTARFKIGKPLFIGALSVVIVIGFILFDPQEWIPLIWNSGVSIPADLRLAQAFAGEITPAPRSGVLYQSREIVFQPQKNDYWQEKQWYPIAIIGEEGKIEYLKCSFSKEHDRKRIILDESWYDFDRRCFLRMLSIDRKVFFINAYDENGITLTCRRDSSTEISLQRFHVDRFALPQPEEFLNLAATLSAFWVDSADVKIVNSKTGKKHQGNPIQQVKSTIHKNDDCTYYYYFDLDRDTNSILEVNTFIHKTPLLTIRPVDTIGERASAYPRNINHIQLHKEYTKRFRFEKLNAPSYIRKIEWEDIRESVWEGFLYPESNSIHFPITGMASILDFGYPSKRMIASVFNVPGGQSVLLLQSFSLNQRYGSKLKMISHPVDKTKNKGWGVWKCPFLDSSVGQIVQIIQPDAASQLYDPHGYLLERMEGSYAILITSGAIRNEMFTQLLENLHSIKRLIR